MASNVNPFWSERIQAEVALREARPEDLPMVPEGESATSEELQPADNGLLDLLDLDDRTLEAESVIDIEQSVDGGRERGELEMEVNRGRTDHWTMSGDDGVWNGISINPGWPRADNGSVSNGGQNAEPPMPPRSWMVTEKRLAPTREMKGEGIAEQGHRDAERRHDDQGFHGGHGRGDGLLRALELEMVEELRRQNEALRLELKDVKHQLQQQSTAAERTPCPKTPTTAMFTPMELPGDRRRHTPGGTRVPEGTPPDDRVANQTRDLPELPPWPWMEKESGKRTHGDSTWTVWTRPQGVRDAQHGLHLRGPGVREGGSNSRCVLPDCGAGPRHGQCGGEESLRNWVEVLGNEQRPRLQVLMAVGMPWTETEATTGEQIPNDPNSGGDAGKSSFVIHSGDWWSRHCVRQALTRCLW